MSTQKRTRKSVRRSAVAGLAAMVILTVTACIPAADGTITACHEADGTIRLIDAEGGEACGFGEEPVEWNQEGPAGATGATGPAGPQGPGALIDTAYAHGHGYNPATQLNRLGVLATVDVPTGATVHVTATKVIGAYIDFPAILDAWVCHRPAGADATALLTVGPAHNVQLWSRARLPLTLTAVIEGLSAGQHEVGLCARATNVHWNDNNVSSVTAMVLAGQ